MVHFKNEIEASTILEEINQEKNTYILATLHRPRNVDTKEALLKIIDLFEQLTKDNNVVFPIHPRTKSNFIKFNLFETLTELKNLIIIGPQNYFSFQN